MALLPVILCWTFPRKVFNDITCIAKSEMTSVTHFQDITTNFSKQIHWYTKIVLADGFTKEITSLDPNQAYPIDDSEYTCLLTMFEYCH